LQKELEEAAKDTRTISPDQLRDVAAGGAFFATSVPNRALLKFVSVLLLTVGFLKLMLQGTQRHQIS
jgi:hypothetical protein